VQPYYFIFHKSLEKQLFPIQRRGWVAGWLWAMHKQNKQKRRFSHQLIIKKEQKTSPAR
jgi:hypothetical protein